MGMTPTTVPEIFGVIPARSDLSGPLLSHQRIPRRFLCRRHGYLPAGNLHDLALSVEGEYLCAPLLVDAQFAFGVFLAPPCCVLNFEGWIGP